MLADQIRNRLIDDVKLRFFEESFPRIIQCLETLSVEEIWQRPNASSNSIGNLVLHLEGNIRQWLLTGVGGQKDVRKRDEEFDERGPIMSSVLIQRIQNLCKEAELVIDQVTAEDLIQEKVVQGFPVNITSILIHLTEHLSYHTGQIAFYTKLLKDIDLGFYADLDLNITEK